MSAIGLIGCAFVVVAAALIVIVRAAPEADDREVRKPEEPRGLREESLKLVVLTLLYQRF